MAPEPMEGHRVRGYSMRERNTGERTLVPVPAQGFLSILFSLIYFSVFVGGWGVGY